MENAYNLMIGRGKAKYKAHIDVISGDALQGKQR